MDAPAWTRLTSLPDTLGESPFWHPQEQRLYWVDIAARRVARLAVDGLQAVGAVEHWPLDEEPGCIAPAEGGGLVLALRSGLYRARTWRGPLERLNAAPYDTARLRFNDGKCDAQGRFWVGSLYEPKDQALGVLYMRDGQGLHPMAGGVTTANGLAWSPDGRTLYWADTAAHRVRAYDVDVDVARGTLSRERVFHQMAPKPAGWVVGDARPYGGRPDGAAVDAEGAYWSAQYEGQRLLRLSPQGELWLDLPTPVSCPTMPCFGGADFKTLFITSARPARGPQAPCPDAGCVFALRVDVPGLPVQAWRP